MYAFTPSTSRAPVTLHRHPIALVPKLIVHLLPGMILSAIGMLRDVPILLLAGLALAFLLNTYHWMAWKIFSVRVRYDRIVVRHLHYGRIQEDIYPVPGRNGITRQQSWIGRRIDTGALTLYPPNHTIRLTMLTPFSATADVLGVDC